MKLYATTMSERGKNVSKGGNDYLLTQFLNEKGEVVARVKYRPNKPLEVDFDGDKIQVETFDLSNIPF